MSKEGKRLEEDLENSCSKQGIFSLRIKDTFIPAQYRKFIKVSKNKYDFIIFSKGKLIPIELKSTKSKSISFSESIIKQHQIESLEKEAIFEHTYPGFIFNFREPVNLAYFIHIQDFITYKNVAEGKDNETTYSKKINKSSIPMGICQEIGIEIPNMKKRTRYHYDIEKMIKDIKNRFSNRTGS